MKEKKVMKLASRGKRLGAYCIDAVVPAVAGMIYFIGIIVRAFLSPGSMMGGFGYNPYSEFGYGYGYGYNQPGSGGLVAAFLIAFLMLLAYAVVQIVFFTKSKTIGKAALGLQVVSSENGEEIGFWKMLFREWFVKKASATVFFLGYIWVLIDDKNRGWHDKVLDTYVVDLKESEKLNAANRRRHQQTRRPADRPAPERRTPEMKSALMSPAEEVKEVMNEAPEAEVHVQGGSGLSPETAGSVLDVSETIVKKADDAAAEMISDNQAPEDSEVQAEPEAAEPEAVPEAEETPAEEANEAPKADATVSEAPEADATVSEAPEEAN